MLRRLIALCALSALTFSLSAQTTTGTIQGRVTDGSGSVIPEAKITILNQATGVQQVVQSSSEGNFVQPYVLPGVYTVTVEKEGFDKYVTTGVRLNVQQTVALEIAMKVGNVATTVEVSASAVQLSTSTSSVATVIQGKAILDLPLNGRNPFALANLTPGVIPSSNNSGSTPWISGGRNASSEITIDGTSVILPENNVSINQTGYTPIVDSIAEFNVITQRARGRVWPDGRRRHQRCDTLGHAMNSTDRCSSSCATASWTRIVGPTIGMVSHARLSAEPVRRNDRRPDLDSRSSTTAKIAPSSSSPSRAREHGSASATRRAPFRLTRGGRAISPTCETAAAS